MNDYTPEEWATILRNAQEALRTDPHNPSHLQAAQAATEALKTSETPSNGVATAVDAGAGFGHEALMGFDDEIAGLGAALANPLHPIQGYQRGRDAQRQVINQAENDSPVATRLGEVVGGVTSALATGGVGGELEASTLGGRIAAQAARGAGYGATEGLGHGEGLGGSLAAAGKDAFYGGAAGATIGALGETGKKGYAVAKAGKDMLKETLGARIPFLGKSALYLRSEIPQAAPVLTAAEKAGKTGQNIPELVLGNAKTRVANAIEEQPQITESSTKVLNQAETSAEKEATAMGKSNTESTTKRDFGEKKNVKIKGDPSEEGQTIKTELTSKDAKGVKGEKSTSTSGDSKIKSEKQSEAFTTTETKKLPKEITPQIRGLQKRVAQAENQVRRLAKKMETIKAEKAAAAAKKAAQTGTTAKNLVRIAGAETGETDNE